MDPPAISIIEEIHAIGDWLVKSCEEDPQPEDGLPDSEEDQDDYWSLYLPHWVYPRAMGHIFRGMSLMQLGLNWNKVSLDSKTGKRGPATGNIRDLRRAAEEYAKGAS